MLRQAAEERAQVSEPLPTYLYFDEAADYFDEQFPILLSQVRKHNIGCVIANQFIDQADRSLVSALVSNTSIKFVGGVSPRDARILAPSLNTTPEFIREQPKMTFAAHIKGATEKAFALRIPMLYMEKMDRMSREDHKALRDTMRSRYARHYREKAPDRESDSSAPVRESENHKLDDIDSSSRSASQEVSQDTDNPEIKPSDTW